VIPAWTRAGDLIRFESLDNCKVPILALGFRITDQSQEKWTERFNAFKFGWGSRGKKAVRGACAVMPAAAAALRLEGPVALICAISSSQEALRAGCQLARLGAALGESLGWQWLPDVLSKRKHRSLAKLKFGTDRDSEVEGAYRADSIIARTVVILDDFATRGSTIGDAARAVREAGDGKHVIGLVLGKNESAEYAKSMNVEINNDHIPQALDDLWTGSI